MDFVNVKQRQVICRQSTISCAVSCHRKWWCQYRMGIGLRGGECKEAAELGAIYHKLQQKGPDNVGEVRDWIREKQNNLMVQVQRGEDLNGDLSRLIGLLTNLFNRALAMVEVFWEKYPQPDHFVTIGSEIKHRVARNGIIFEGTIDKLLLNNLDSSEWIRDHKSTGRGLDAIFGGLAWSLQARIYRILVTDYRQCVPDAGKLKGFILDGIMKPGIKLCKTDEKNAKEWNVSVEDAYLRRVKEWYRDYEVKANLEGKKRDKALYSVGMMYAEPLFPDELNSCLAMMAHLGNIPTENVTAFGRDVTRMACYQWGRQCIYHDLCSTNSKQWDRLFETKYKFIEEEGDEDENDDD